MGIGVQAIELLQIIRDLGYFVNKTSIIELGSQQFAPDLPTARAAIQRFMPEIETNNIHIPQNLYTLLGFNDYQCIDLDGANNAHVFNLNLPLDKVCKFRKSFDVVSNHGTTKHVFNQEECFRNVHNMTNQGGLMIHALPSQGYQNHSFFNYHPSFFLDLAAANNYEMLGLFYNVGEEIFPYYDRCLIDRGFLATENLAVFAVMRKIGMDKFVVPFDGRYYFNQKGDDFTPRSDVGSHYRVEHNTYPLSNQSKICKKVQQIADIKIILPVWGDQFVGEFVNFNLPHQVKSSLLDLGDNLKIEYVIVTDAKGLETIVASPCYKILANKTHVKFIDCGSFSSFRSSAR